MFVRSGAVAVLFAILAVAVPVSGQEGGKPAHDVLIDAPTVLAPESRASIRVVVYESKGLGKVAPMAGADVTVALVDSKNESKPLYAGKTGATGSADIAFAVPAVADGDYVLAITTKSPAGEHIARQPVKVKREFKILLVTDKPIYQPGQEIHLRALAVDEMTLKALGDQELLFEIEDAKGNKVFKNRQKTNAYGVTSADFQLADEVLMGDYKITATLAGSKAEKSVVVKKYVLPKFKIEIKTDKKFYMPKETVKCTVQADYFFGKPVAGGEIIVKASTFDVAFRDFANAKAKTDEKGAGTFEIQLPDYFVGSPLDKGNAFAALEIQVMDTAEHIETVSKSVPVANQPILVGAVPESGKLVPGLENIVYVLASTPDGSPVEADVTLKLGATTVAGKTNPSGFAAIKITPDGKDLVWNGTVAVAQATVTAKDKTGAEATRAIQLSSEQGKDQLLVRLDKAIYNIGDKITLEAYGTFEKTDIYIDVVRRGQTVLGTVATMEKGKASCTIPLTPDLFGTIEVHAYAFLGSSEIVRDTKVAFAQPASELKIDVTADKPVYKPGEDAVLKFLVTDRGGAGVSSALGVIVVDTSVYALQDLQPGLEKIYFMLEKELMAPKIEIKWGAGFGEMIEPKKDQTADGRRQGAAVVLLAPVVLPARHAVVNTLAVRLQQMRGTVNTVYYGLYNYLTSQKPVFWQVGAGGKREWKKNLLDEMVDKKILQKDQLKDPWGRAVVLDEMGALSHVFTLDHWSRVLSQAAEQAIWQGLWQHVLVNDALSYDAAKKEWSWKPGVLDSLVKAKLIAAEQTKNCFGEAIEMEKLGAQDGAFKAENFAKIAANQRRQVIWQRILDWTATKGGITWSNGYAWEAGLLDLIAKGDPAFARSIVRPEGGAYDLDAMAKENPAFAAANVAKIASLSRRQVLFNALTAAWKKEGLAAVADFDPASKSWVYPKGMIATLVKGGYLSEAQSKDSAGRTFDLAELAKEDGQFSAARWLGAVMREAAAKIDGAICRTWHKAKNALPEGDVVQQLIDDEVIKKEAASDAWGTPFKLVAVKEGVASTLQCGLLARKFTVMSAGPDKAFGTADDVNAGAMTVQPPYRATYGGCVFFQQDPTVRHYTGTWGAEDDQNEMFDMERRPQDGFRGRGEGAGGGGRLGGVPKPDAPAAKAMEELRKDKGGEKKEANDAKADPGQSGGAEGGAPVRVREYFPETLLWKPVLITGDDGRAELRIAMADTITTWRLTASANTVDGRMGSTTSDVLVFQDFFVDIDLPVALTQNDVVSVPVAVYNYLKEKQTVELTLAKDDWFELRDDEKKSLEIGPGEVKVAYYRLRAMKLGAANKLTVHASGSKNKDAQDAIRRSVEVVPDGKAVDIVFNGQLSGSQKLTFTVPAGAVDGANRLLFKAYPGVFASVMDGLEGLLRMPGG